MNTADELKATFDQLKGAFENFKAENNAQIAKGVRDALAEAKLTNIGQQIDDLTAKRDDLVKRVEAEAKMRADLERTVNELKVKGVEDPAEAKALVEWYETVKVACEQRKRRVPETITLEEFRAAKAAQQKWLRYGEKSLTPEEEKAMTVGSDVEGGYFVTPDIGGRMISKIYEVSPIRQIAAVQSIGSDSFEGMEDLDEADAGWVGETGSRDDTTTPEVGKWKIEVNEMYAQPKATQKLLDDSSVDIEAWLAAKVAKKFARLEGDAFVNGVTPTRPRGFTTYTTVATADSSRAWGQLEYVPTGASGAFHTTQADPLFDLLSKFKAHYLLNGKWVTRRTVIAAIRKFKTSTTLEYIWQPGLQLGQPDKLLGYPIVIAEDMPAIAANSLSMAFGDWSGYQIVDRLGVRVLRDPFTSKPYVRFYTTKRTGGGVIDFEAIKLIKFAAS